jgi:HlyD family secretion protein
MAKKKKNNKWLLIGLIVVVAALVVMAVLKGKSKPKGEAVFMEKVEKRTISETVSASGKVFPETEVKISSDVSGEIVELYVEEGDSVNAGALLAKIDPDAYQSAVERGEAGMNSAKSQLAISRSNIEASRAQLEQIGVQLDNAKKIHERNMKLLKDGVISQADVETSESTLLQFEANYRSAQSSLKSSQQNANASEFAVKSSEASLRELKTSLNRTTIKAPTNGIISALSVEQGERVVGTIQMTGTEMMRISNFNSMEVRVDVSENDILKVSDGDKVEIEVDAYLDRKFIGRVTQIANAASNSGSSQSLNTDQVTNFVVKIRIDPTSYADLTQKGINPFRPGMSASVDIFTDEREGALSVPIQSVTTRDPNADKDEEEEKDEEEGADSKSDKKKDEKVELKEVVFVVKQDTAHMVEVKTDIQDDEYIIIVDGLKEDDVVVTGPYSAVSKKLKDGILVREKEIIKSTKNK